MSENSEPREERRLYQPEELPTLLHLNEEQVQRLLDTQQLPQILICGQYRIDSLDVDRLICMYKNTASRRIQ
jgi:hypothetical protein